MLDNIYPSSIPICLLYYLSVIALPTTPPTPADPCYPSPCGSNARCRSENGYPLCQCAPEYFGNPYEGCRPECLTSSDCTMNKACIRNKCQDPCPGTCGINALCSVSNHIPICSCPQGYSGDAFRLCSLIPPTGTQNDTCHTFKVKCGENYRRDEYVFVQQSK